MDSGWDVKHLVRLIVTSQTYRQVSTASPELLARDPYNRWLARQSRFRLDAELVRDNALAISGLLVSKIGGPSVKPYQPDGYWENLNFPVRSYEATKGETSTVADCTPGGSDRFCIPACWPSMPPAARNASPTAPARTSRSKRCAAERSHLRGSRPVPPPRGVMPTGGDVARIAGLGGVTSSPPAATRSSRVRLCGLFDKHREHRSRQPRRRIARLAVRRPRRSDRSSWPRGPTSPACC